MSSDEEIIAEAEQSVDDVIVKTKKVKTVSDDYDSWEVDIRDMDDKTEKEFDEQNG